MSIPTEILAGLKSFGDLVGKLAPIWVAERGARKAAAKAAFDAFMAALPPDEQTEIEAASDVVSAIAAVVDRHATPSVTEAPASTTEPPPPATTEVSQ